jgi:hypothetical protein
MIERTLQPLERRPVAQQQMLVTGRERDPVHGACPEQLPKHRLDRALGRNGAAANPDFRMRRSDFRPDLDRLLRAEWSPDGRKIVFVCRSAGQNDVYTVNADGSGPSEVSGTPHDEGGPPDWGMHPLLP